MRSRTITVTVNRSTGDAFDAVLRMPPKMMPGAKVDADGWWSFTGPHGRSRLKFYEDRARGVLDHRYEDEESSWDVPMRVVPSGESSDIVITLNKPAELTDEQFDARMEEIGQMVSSMKGIIEGSDTCA